MSFVCQAEEINTGKGYFCKLINAFLFTSAGTICVGLGLNLGNGRECLNQKFLFFAIFYFYRSGPNKMGMNISSLGSDTPCVQDDCDWSKLVKWWEI